jgi:RES domain-containing protein
VRLRTIAYRAHHPHWSWQPLSGEGAKRYGGRFNSPGTPALYLSLDVAVAIREASQGFACRFPPLTLVTYDIDCTDIVDLTAPGALTKHAITSAQLSCPWQLLHHENEPVPTWALAEKLIKAGTAGIVVRSYAPGNMAAHKNLILWNWSEHTPHQVSVFDPHDRLKPPTR